MKTKMTVLSLFIITALLASACSALPGSIPFVGKLLATPSTAPAVPAVLAAPQAPASATSSQSQAVQPSPVPTLPMPSGDSAGIVAALLIVIGAVAGLNPFTAGSIPQSLISR